MQIVEWYDELVAPDRQPGRPAQPRGGGRRGRRTARRAGGARGADDDLPRHAAVAAYLHERDGDLATAARLYAEAARAAPNLAERDHLPSGRTHQSAPARSRSDTTTRATRQHVTGPLTESRPAIGTAGAFTCAELSPQRRRCRVSTSAG